MACFQAVGILRFLFILLTILYHLSFMEKFAKKSTFDHKFIRKWSARSVLKTLWEKERVDPITWFPEQAVIVIWQNASLPELSNKHQDIARLVVRTALPVRSFLYAWKHIETNIDCAFRTLNSVKDAPWSAPNSLVFQIKELTPTKCFRLAHSKVQDHVLWDILKLGAAATKAQWGKITVYPLKLNL
eukprot:g30159.t1